MTARPITAQRVRDAVRVCAPIAVDAIIQALAKGDPHAAREVRRCVTELLKHGQIAVHAKPDCADRRVLVAVRNPPPVPAPEPPAPPPEPHAALAPTIRVGRYRPPMPREPAPHLIPAPAIQPRWPAHHIVGAVLAPRINSKGFPHG